MSDLFDTLDDINVGYLIKGLEPIKQSIVKDLISGSNFNKIGIERGIKPNRIYKIKQELQNDFLWLRTQYNGRDTETFEDQLFGMMLDGVKKMPLSRFSELYLSDYSNLDFTSISQWEQNKTPDDKIIVAITLIIRELFIREKPIVIDYYNQDRKALVNFIQKLKIAVKKSPIVHDRLDILRTDADLGIRLKDTSQVRAVWEQGRHPNKAGTITIFDDNNENGKKNKPKISYI